MKTVSMVAAIALLGLGCVSSEPRYRAEERGRERHVRTFDAYTTSGDYVRVEDDGRGDLVVVDPPQLSGAPVAMIGEDSGNGLPLVALENAARPRRDDRDRDRDREHDREGH